MQVSVKETELRSYGVMIAPGARCNPPVDVVQRNRLRGGCVRFDQTEEERLHRLHVGQVVRSVALHSDRCSCRTGRSVHRR